LFILTNCNKFETPTAVEKVLKAHCFDHPVYNHNRIRFILLLYLLESSECGVVNSIADAQT